jgi:hypothetical protein
MLKMKSIEESATFRLSFGLWFIFFQILFELGAETEKPKHSGTQTMHKYNAFSRFEMIARNRHLVRVLYFEGRIIILKNNK